MENALPGVLVHWLFPAALSLAMACDLVSRIIPNLVVGGLVAGFAILCAFSPVPDLAARLLLAAAILGVGFALFAQDIIGAGDAKLAAALALWLDPAQLPAFALLCGGIGLLLVAAATWRARRGGGLGRIATLPYGVALAGAGLLLFPHSVLMAAA
ncbi:prepilin peptidase [Aquabacter cavernae]|uniref:prepilin peptidase n=1 Tax=Aquabacter cavernae TaxID=2496029 RepID=UPI000F8F14A3|nr:prepilin peptidase [Aquabacter cavernae]